jgi:hypothetical protein
MRNVHVELFNNLVDKSFLCMLDHFAIKSDLNSYERMGLSNIGNFEFYLDSHNRDIH